MTVEFELDGQHFTALNGGPVFKFNEAVSFQVELRRPGGDRLLLGQARRRRRPQGAAVRLAQGQVRACSWQVVPTALAHMFGDPKNPGSQRAMQAMLQMKKIDLGALERAFAGS